MTSCQACHGTGLDGDVLCPVCGGTPDPAERARLAQIETERAESARIQIEAYLARHADRVRVL